MLLDHSRLVLLTCSLTLGGELCAQEVAPESPAGPQLQLPSLKSIAFSGQYRLRYESMMNYDFDSDAGATRDFFGQRTRFDIRPELTDEIHAFFQLQDGRNWGEETSTLDDSADGFDLHQGYVEWKNVPGIGGTTRLGRQAIALGSQRLISSLEWATQGRSFDGLVHTWANEDTDDRLSFLYVHAREIMTAPEKNDDAWLGGLFATLTPIDDSEVDLYALWLQNDETAAGGSESRITLGGRWVQHVGPVSLGIEGATQTGEVDNNDIPIGETFAAAANAKFQFSEDGIKPYVDVELNVASGDDPTTADDERFNTLFPFAHFYLGMMDFALWENIRHGTVAFGCSPMPRGKLVASYHIFRAMESDTFGGPTNPVMSAGAAGQSKDIGQELNLLFNYQCDTQPAKVGLQLGYGIFFPGDGTQQQFGNDDLAHFFYAQSDFRF